MNILKSARKNFVINKFVGQILKGTKNPILNIYSFIIKRWSPSGIISCKFEDTEFKLYNESDDGLPYYFYYDETYPEKSDLKLFLALSQKSKTIIDIGANTGLFSVLAGIVSPKSNIMALEPYSSNANRLRKNLIINSLNNVNVFEIAIGDINGEIQFAVPDDERVTDVSSLDIEFSKKMYNDVGWINSTVKIKKLDDFAEENRITVDLIKCDVETFEMSVFRGSQRILKEDRPTIIFECFLDEERKEFFNQILLDYVYYAYLILEEGVVYTKEGFVSSQSLNYLISPVAPTQTFIGYKDIEELWNRLLIRPLI